MNTVAAKQNAEAALAEDVQQAGALIRRGRIEDVCSTLESAIEKAITLQDIAAVEEIRDLADEAIGQTVPGELDLRDRCRVLHRRAQDQLISFEQERQHGPGWQRRVEELDAEGDARSRDLVAAIAIHVGVWLVWFVAGAIGGAWSDLGSNAITDQAFSAASLFWVAVLGFLLYRWLEYADRWDRLAQTSAMWFAIAAVWFPVLLLISKRVRRFAGLVRGPR